MSEFLQVEIEESMLFLTTKILWTYQQFWYEMLVYCECYKTKIQELSRKKETKQ